MIVMASHGRGAVGRWTFGSVADRVARGSLIPVTIICPEPDEGIAGVEVRRIVVALDGSDLSHRALPVARDLAVRLSVPVLLVQAINPAASLYPSLAAGAVASEDVFEETFHSEEEQAAGNLRNAEQQLRARGIEVTTSVQVGPTIAAIESVVEPGDVIVITSHGRSGIRRWLLGSVAERLIRCALAPVILVPAAERERVGATEAVHAFAPLPA
jgi:nucleotide-binding universal stress UspA family protein